MKISLVLLFGILAFIFSPTVVEAKVLPQALKTSRTVAVKNPTVAGINVSPKLRNDKRALIVNFSNLQNASSVSYTLTYTTSGQEEGAMGSLNLTGSNFTQELLFGTCSKNICRYHPNITNMRLEVTYANKAGKKYIKRFRIKTY